MEKERERIERMLREGKISKEQSEELLKALEESTVAEKERRVKKPKTKIINISIAIIALIIAGGLLATHLPKIKLQREIDRKISQLGTGDQFKALNVLIKIGEPAVPALIEALQDQSNPFTRRWEAAKALGAIKDERAVEPLIKAMSDENEVVRRVTAEALGRLGDKRAIPVLKEALKDPKYYYDERTGRNRYYTRESSAEALEKLGIKVIQRGNEYLVAGQELQEEIPSRDIAIESERLYQRGAKLWRAGNIDEAIKTLREVVDKYPKTNRAGCALMYLGQIYMGQNNYQKAVEIFREAVEKHPSSRYGDGVIVGAYSRLYLGKCYIHEEKWDEAK
ncbi:HEAT repeat domain-containing protein, partial [bacterium]|nr:HEAT repeat domain-containing protein [bacterium]